MTENLSDCFCSNNLSLSEINIDLYIKEVFLNTNADLKKQNDPEMILFSGSTCISIFYTSENLLCANVGDSKAILGRFSDNGNFNK